MYFIYSVKAQLDFLDINTHIVYNKIKYFVKVIFMKITMVAPYNIKNNMSWSGTPLSLYNALKNCEENIVSTVNLSEYYTDFRVKTNLLSHLDIKRTIVEHNPVSKLGPSIMNPLNSRILNKICKNDDADVLIEFGGFVTNKDMPPYYVYTDASHDLALDYYKITGVMPVNHNYSVEETEKAAEYVRRIYQNAAGVFCMSDFLARSMINTTGVKKEKVYTVYAGSNWHDIKLPYVEPKKLNKSSDLNILLTGIDYYRKGIDIAIDAVEILNKNTDRRFILNLCGTDRVVEQKDYIINHGFTNKKKLVSLLQKSDLFVLPSRFDCFGIAFVEAMTFGLPCIGRKLCAMPEIIDEGINGELITDDNPEKLAGLIFKICSNESLYHRYSENAIKKAKVFTWENTAKRIMNVLNSNK